MEGPPPKACGNEARRVIDGSPFSRPTHRIANSQMSARMPNRRVHVDRGGVMFTMCELI